MATYKYTNFSNFPIVKGADPIDPNIHIIGLSSNIQEIRTPLVDYLQPTINLVKDAYDVVSSLSSLSTVYAKNVIFETDDIYESDVQTALEDVYDKLNSISFSGNASDIQCVLEYENRTYNVSVQEYINAATTQIPQSLKKLDTNIKAITSDIETEITTKSLIVNGNVNTGNDWIDSDYENYPDYDWNISQSTSIKGWFLKSRIEYTVADNIYTCSAILDNSPTPTFESTTKLSTVSIASVYNSQSTLLSALSTGDSLSMKNYYSINGYMTVVSVVGNMVIYTVDNKKLTNASVLDYAIGNKYRGSITNQNDARLKECSIWCVDKPNVGVAELTRYSAIVGGIGCRIFGQAAIAAGEKNTVLDDYGVAFGKNNLVGYCCFSVGQNNKSRNYEYSNTLGASLTVTNNYQTIIGKQFTANNNAIFAVGYNNKTLFEVATNNTVNIDGDIVMPVYTSESSTTIATKNGKNRYVRLKFVEKNDEINLTFKEI